MFPDPINHAVAVLRQGGIIAYPTEAVYGLGCDPSNLQAIKKLLELKRRKADKGLILIAADFHQLLPYLDSIDAPIKDRILASWPGPVTWLWPAKPEVSRWLRGEHETIAVRVTKHSQAAELCRAFGGPLVSTSANLSNHPPARNAQQVREQFDERLDYILEGPVGGLARPSEIRDALTGKILR